MFEGHSSLTTIILHKVVFDWFRNQWFSCSWYFKCLWIFLYISNVFLNDAPFSYSLFLNLFDICVCFYNICSFFIWFVSNIFDLYFFRLFHFLFFLHCFSNLFFRQQLSLLFCVIRDLEFLYLMYLTVIIGSIIRLYIFVKFCFVLKNNQNFIKLRWYIYVFFYQFYKMLNT